MSGERRAGEAAIEAQLVEALFALSVLLVPPLGHAPDVDAAERWIGKLAPLLTVREIGSEAEAVKFGLDRYAAVLGDESVSEANRRSCARGEMRVHLRAAALIRLRRALARLKEMGLHEAAD